MQHERQSFQIPFALIASAFLCIELTVVSHATGQERVTPWNWQKYVQWMKPQDVRVNGTREARIVASPSGANAVLPDGPDIRVFPSTNPQAENSIAVNPANSLQLMLSTNGTPTPTGQTWFFTTNGGDSWFGNESSPNAVECYGDPVAFFNVSGTTAYWATLRYPGGIGVVRTTNCGASWSSMTDADITGSTGDDKEHVTADLSGVYPSHVYASWTDFASGIPAVRVSRSTDGGGTWNPAHAFATGADVGQGVNIATGPAGEVYLAFASYAGGYLPEAGIRVAKSLDGGATWTSAAVMFPVSGIRVSGGGNEEFGGIRVNSFPSMAVDRSAGERRGWVYIVYADRNTGDADVYLRRSADGGTSWSGAIRVNGDSVGNGRQQWFPSIAVDPSNGVVSVGYHNEDTAGMGTCRYVACSSDGGDTWRRVKVGDVRFVPASLPLPYAPGFMGDYYETAAAEGKVWTTWSDDRSGEFNAYVSRMDHLFDFGWVKGRITSDGHPVAGARVDFPNDAESQAAISDSMGNYNCGVLVGEPGGYGTRLMRVERFGYSPRFDSVTVVKDATVTRNVLLTASPTGALAGRVFRPDSSGIAANISVIWNGQTVVDGDPNDPATGWYSRALPNGIYDIIIDPPSPYGTSTLSGLIVSYDTARFSSMVHEIIEATPASVTETLDVDAIGHRTMVLVNTSNDSTGVMLSNSGIGGPAPHWLTHDPDSLTLPPGASRTILHTFNTNGLVPYSTYEAEISMAVDHPDVSAPIVLPARLVVRPVNGRSVNVSPSAVDFGRVMRGSESAQVLRLKNVGTSTLHVEGISEDHPRFAIGAFPESLRSGETFDLVVTFSPVAIGREDALLHVLTDDPVHDSVKVSLSGVGAGIPRLDVSPAALNAMMVVGEDTLLQWFTIRNIGDDTLSYVIEESDTLIGRSVVSPGSPGIGPGGVRNQLLPDATRLLPDRYPWCSTDISSAVLPPGAQMSIVVRYHPTAEQRTGEYAGMLTVRGNAPDSANVSLHFSYRYGSDFVTLFAPNGSETFGVGQSVYIVWSDSAIRVVRFEYSTDAGISWNFIRDTILYDAGITPDTGKVGPGVGKYRPKRSLLWRLPPTPTTQALIRVSDWDKPYLYDVSDTLFSIVERPPDGWSVQDVQSSDDISAVEIVDDQVAWAVSNDGSAFRTRNGGLSWQRSVVGSIVLTSLSAHDSLHAVVCGFFGSPPTNNVFRTTDGGAHWIRVYELPSDGESYYYLQVVHMFDAREGMAAGDNLYLTTTDGGETWERIPLPPGWSGQISSHAQSWIDRNRGWVATIHDVILATQDGGKNWTWERLPVSQAQGVVFVSPARGLTGGNAGRVSRSSNGGLNWTYMGNAGGGDASPAGVAIPEETFWLASGDKIYRSTDFAASWTMEHIRSGEFHDIDVRTLASKDIIVGYAVGSSGIMSKYVEYLPPSHAVRGVVFEDSNGNLKRDPGEEGLPGWSVSISGPVTLYTTTDTSGTYRFDSLPSGSYVASCEAEPGWIHTGESPRFYSLNLSAGDTIPDCPFPMFKTGTVSGFVWSDDDRDGLMGGAEEPLAGWHVEASRLFGVPMAVVTDSLGRYVFTGMPPGVFTISLTVHQGYSVSFPPPLGVHTIDVTSGCTQAQKNFGAHQTWKMPYRTFTPAQLALATDNHGKIGKEVRKKADRVEFVCTIAKPLTATDSSAIFEFNQFVAATAYRLVAGEPAESIASISGKKFSNTQFPLERGGVLQLHGYGNTGRPVRLRCRFGGVSPTADPLFVLNVPRLPMPNPVNLIKDLYTSGTLFNTGGINVGAQPAPIELSAFGWAQLRTYRDVLKSLYERGAMHGGRPSSFEYYGGRSFVGRKAKVPPSKHNNLLFAEQLLLRLNIVASTFRRTPFGLGELRFNDGNAGPLVGKTLSEIAAAVDSFLTYRRSFLPGVGADSLYHVVRKINEAFAGQIDTISFSGSLRFRGTRAVADVPYLLPAVSIPSSESFVDDRKASEPKAFRLYQNYPNPCNPFTTIRFDIPVTARVSIRVFNILGQEVATPLLDEIYDAGTEEVDIDASAWPSGVYFYQLHAAQIDEEDRTIPGAVFTTVGKMMLIR